MGKIFFMMGKSSSGKDTLFKEISLKFPHLKKVVPYTTRPIRSGEVDGREYFFVTEEELQKMLDDGKVIERRVYMTAHGPWNYFTVDDGQIELDKNDYLMIGTLESYDKLRTYFGESNIIPIYIEVEDGERLMRALTRELSQEEPKYKEMCRRFLADCEDFSEEKIERLQINKRFYNIDKVQCLEEIERVIYNGKL